MRGNGGYIRVNRGGSGCSSVNNFVEASAGNMFTGHSTVGRRRPGWERRGTVAEALCASKMRSGLPSYEVATSWY